MDIEGTHNSTNVTDLEQGFDFGHGNIPILLETSFCCALVINHGTVKVSMALKTRGRATEEQCDLFCLRTGIYSEANPLKH